MLWSRFQRWRDGASERQGISLNREDTERLDQLARSVRRVRMSRSLLGLAWTAGPVTALGLYGGYYIGYGQLPSNQQLVYFVSFTVLSGLIALAAKVLYDGTWGYRNERSQRYVVEVTDKLGDLILSVRNLIVHSLDGEARQRESATQLLQRVDLSPSGIRHAVEQLTGDPSLAELLAQVDNYRRAGLTTRIRDLHERSGIKPDSHIDALRTLSPVAADILRLRYSGDIALLRHGMPRAEHFIARVLAAIEQDNLLLITMQDVESMLILAFELINGREIPMLIFDYRGQWRLAAALDRMERRRSRYRIAQAAGSNRVRSLASWLVEVDLMLYDEAPEGISSSLLIERVCSALDRLAEQLQQLAHTVDAGATERYDDLRQLAEKMINALRLYRYAHESFLRTGELHADFLQAAASWNKLLDQSQQPTEQLQVGPRGRGVHILEKVVQLSDDERMEVCEHIARYLRSQHLESHETKGLFERRSDRDYPLTFESARRLAIEVALALEPHVHLSYPEIQRGIGATYASYLGDLEPGMSAREKRTIAEAVAQDVEEDMSEAAEHLASALVRHYRVNLNQDACQFLHNTYGARQSVLAVLSEQQNGEAAAQSPLAARPAMVPPAQRRWYRSVVLARRLVTELRD
ncbi:MAG: hypothetical protein Q8S94_00365 [Pseudohongiella sp.]|nr:hypothetical protein [Pseudohongiella sp.]